MSSIPFSPVAVWGSPKSLRTPPRIGVQVIPHSFNLMSKSFTRERSSMLTTLNWSGSSGLHSQTHLPWISSSESPCGHARHLSIPALGASSPPLASFPLPRSSWTRSHWFHGDCNSWVSITSRSYFRDNESNPLWMSQPYPLARISTLILTSGL